MDKTFSELPREAQLALFDAWLDGHAIECYVPVSDKWTSPVMGTPSCISRSF